MQTAANYGIRVIANMIILRAWRNGPIENVHAGRYVGHGLNERRVLPRAAKSIIRHAQSGLFSGLKAVDYLKYGRAWPPPAERVLPFMHGLIGPRGLVLHGIEPHCRASASQPPSGFTIVGRMQRNRHPSLRQPRRRKTESDYPAMREHLPQ
jgi:hypothetical protein